MKILVANLGSTSFKYRFFDGSMENLILVDQGGYERVVDYAECINDALKKLLDAGHIDRYEAIDAVGFKTVLGFDVSGCVAADDDVIEDLRRSAALAPAHNPAYANGIEQFGRILPHAHLVALYETAFYQWASPASRQYAIPQSWRDIGIRKNGFHGASHKFIAERSADLMGRQDVAESVRNLYHGGGSDISGIPLRVVSCHLGGSSSVTGILNGRAIDSSMGLSPQSGIPQNNRVGELDSMAVTYAMKTLGLGIEEIEQILTKESGLLGLSGVSNDMRDIEAAASEGNSDAKMALDSFVYSVRSYIGSFMFQMGGLDAIVFTGGIGEKGASIRKAICLGLSELGIQLDHQLNAETTTPEACISSPESKVNIFVITANEELVIARETYRFVENQMR